MIVIVAGGGTTATIAFRPRAILLLRSSKVWGGHRRTTVGFEQDVAIAMQYPVLAVTDQMATSSERSAAHLEELRGRIVRKDEVLVRPDEDVDHRERTG